MQRTRHAPAIAAAIAIAALATAASGALASGGTLNGAGSTLVAPLVQTIWSPDFKKSTGIQVNYAGVGSSAGIAAITGHTVDLGASDAPLTSSQMASCACKEIAWALSATGPAFYIPGITTLNLSATVLVNIYLGKITKWNDPAIRDLNKGAKLPSLAITPVYRADGSGDTYAFTNFLSRANPTWAKRIGAGTLVAWPQNVGTGARGNAGVVGVIESTPGAVGYVSAYYVRQTPLIHQAAVENQAGKFVVPSIPNIAAAAALVTAVTPNAAISIVNPPWTPPKKGAKLTPTETMQQLAYPIATYTYAMVSSKPKQASLLQRFLTFAISTAEQKKGAPLVFAPLPAQTVAAAQATIKSL